MLNVPLWTCCSILLPQLHWLNVEFRTNLKLACLTNTAISTCIPTYLRGIHALLMTPSIPSRSCDHQVRVSCWATMINSYGVSCIPRNGIDCHCPFRFLVQLHLLSSKSGSTLYIIFSSWHSMSWKVKCIFTCRVAGYTSALDSIFTWLWPRLKFNYNNGNSNT